MKKTIGLSLVVIIYSLLLSVLFVCINMKILSVITVGIASILILFIQGIRFYDFGLILVPFMFYLNIGGAINTSVSDFIIALWILSVITNKKNRNITFHNDIVSKTAVYMKKYSFIFMGVMFLSMMNFVRWENPLVLQGIISIIKILICFFYAMYTLFYIDVFGRDRFLCIMAYGTLFFDILMIIGVIGYTVGIDLGLTFPGTFRATGTFEDPNLAAAYLFLMISFAIVYFSEQKKYLMLGLSIILTLISVILTSSKGALVALVIGLIFLLIINLIKGNFGMLLKLIVGYLMVGTVLYYLYQNSSFVQQICEPIFNRFEEFTSNISGDHSLAHREFLWNTAVNLGLTEPILGIGVEQFRPAATQYTGQVVWNIVHNTYLTFFCELGIVGLLSFFRLWIKNAWNHFKLIKKNNSSVYYLFSILCVSVSMWSISLGNFRTLWIFMTFVLYEYKRAQNNLDKKEIVMVNDN